MDRILTISTGKSRLSTAWQTKKTSWGKIVRALEKPRITPESMLEYNRMPRDTQSDVKDIGGYVGGIIDGTHRKASAVTARTMFTLDADYADDTTWDIYSIFIGCAAVKYSTHKDRKTARRFRIIGPYDREVTPEEHEAISRMIASIVGIDYFDDSTYQASRLMYWPSVSRDQSYDYAVLDGPTLCADEYLQMYGPGDSWKDVTQWPVSSRVGAARKKSASQQGNPLEKPGIIGQFCRAYTIEEAIEAFLPDKYISTEKEGRWTYAEGSTAAGLVLYDNGLFAYSNHATDPISGRLVNAYDLVRIHKFGSLDVNADPKTVITELPSSKEMKEFALHDGRVKRLISDEREASAQADFASITSALTPKEEETDDDDSWKEKLKLNKYGVPEASARNMLLILLNDKRLKNKIKYDEFSHKFIVTADLPWRKKSFASTWVDEDDSCLRNYINIIYGTTTKFELKDAVVEIALNNKVHPVRQFLENIVWDGQERLDRIFVKYLNAADTEYVRAVTRCTLVAAVKRIFEPGCKFDEMLILAGPQAVGKTLLVQKLACGWFGKCSKDIENKDTLAALEGRWIIEMDEMRAKRKSDNNAMKSFLSTQSDIYRPAFGHYVKEFPRQCIFIGTTNDDDFLQDPTGDRRSWPIACKGTKTDLVSGLTRKEIEQIWGEAYFMYVMGESIKPSAAVLKTAEDERDKYKSDTEAAGIIEDYLDRPIKRDWDNMPMSDRINFMDTETIFNTDAPDCIPRDKTCVVEIIRELFNGDLRQRTLVTAILKQSKKWRSAGKSIRFKQGMGVQRLYVRRNWG